MWQSTIDGRPFTEAEQADWDYANHARWAIHPLTRPEWDAQQARIAEAIATGTLSTNPYEW